MNHIDLSGRVAVITGGAQGIGYATAQRMLNSGARVVLWDRNPQALAEAEQSLSSQGAVSGVVVELIQEASVKAAAQSTLEQFGKVDILVNNAGITRDTLAMRMKDDDWDAVINTNLKAVFAVSRAAIKPMMKQRYGRIVSITSVVGACGPSLLHI